MIYLMIPFIMQLGFASINLDDGHVIRSQFVKKDTMAPESGFIVKIGDMADIQGSLHGNSCLIRVSELTARFERETKLINQRCTNRLKIYQKKLDESQKLNEHLKQKLDESDRFSNRLMIASGVVVGALTATTVYLSLR